MTVMAKAQNNPKKKTSPKKRRKLQVFLTRFKLRNDPTEYGWRIKAYDFEEAEMICKRIGHILDGLRG